MLVLRIKQVQMNVGLSRTTIWRRVKAGDFPTPKRLGGPNTRAVGWDSADIDGWVAGLPAVGGESPQPKEESWKKPSGEHFGSKRHPVRLPKATRHESECRPASRIVPQCPGWSTAHTCPEPPAKINCPTVISSPCNDLKGQDGRVQICIDVKSDCNSYNPSVNTCNFSVN